MTDRHKAPAYSLRLSPELKRLVEALASVSGHSLNTWLILTLEAVTWEKNTSRYAIPVARITERLQALTPFDHSKHSAYPLRMSAALQERMAHVAAMNRRSISKEIIFRIISSLSDDQFDSRNQTVIVTSPASGISEQLADAWAKLNQAITNLTHAPATRQSLKTLERKRKAFDVLMSAASKSSVTKG